MYYKNSILILLLEKNKNLFYLVGKSLKFLNKNKRKNFIIVGQKNFFDKKFQRMLHKIDDVNSRKISNKVAIIDIVGKNNKSYFNKTINFAIQSLKNKKAEGFINLPINKKILPKQFIGFTEFFSSKLNTSGKETMLLYNRSFSVSPVTTHIEVNNISRFLTKKKIINNVKNIKKFYKKYIKKDVNILITGLNPHAGIDMEKMNEERKIIIPAIKELRKNYANISGPYSADSVYNYGLKLKKPFCIVGMYHDQVLPIFKSINKFDGINITIGSKFLRASPDHGTASNITNPKNIYNLSFKKCISFFSS